MTFAVCCLTLLAATPEMPQSARPSTESAISRAFAVRPDAAVASPRRSELQQRAQVGGAGLRLEAEKPAAWMLGTDQRRPASLPGLYATLGALQALDVYSTRRALGAGAHETNGLMRKASGGSITMLAVKALSSAGTIYFTERAWKKNRKGAIALMAVINGVTAAVVVRNVRNGR